MGSWSDRRVLVTGAAGFIGSHLAERLVAEGARVRALVHYNACGSRGWLEQSEPARAMEIVPGDVTDSESVHSAVEGMEIVFHLAALIAIPYSYRAPRSYLKVNAEGTLNVLEAARRCKVGRVVHTSSSEVYGTARVLPISESHPLQAQSPYAASKTAADKMVEAYYRSFDVPVVTVRPFNTFGPRQSARAVIPAVIGQCLACEEVKLGNLEPTRDFNFVSNTVDGFLRAALAPAAVGQTFNLGSGREISIRELVRLIGDLTGRGAVIRPDPQRVRPAASEVERLLADSTLARRELGWHPAVDLEQGLQVTVDWIRGRPERHRPELYAI